MRAPTFGSMDMQLSFRMTSRLALATPCVVQRFEGHTGRHGAVSDHGNMLPVVLTFIFGGDGHAQRRPMEVLEWPTPKVSYSLSPRLGKPLMPLYFRLVWKHILPAGEDLMPVGLVAHVPHQLVVRRIRMHNAGLR